MRPTRAPGCVPGHRTGVGGRAPRRDQGRHGGVLRHPPRGDHRSSRCVASRSSREAARGPSKVEGSPSRRPRLCPRELPRSGGCRTRVADQPACLLHLRQDRLARDQLAHGPRGPGRAWRRPLRRQPAAGLRRLQLGQEGDANRGLRRETGSPKRTDRRPSRGRSPRHPRLPRSYEVTPVGAIHVQRPADRMKATPVGGQRTDEPDRRTPERVTLTRTGRSAPCGAGGRGRLAIPYAVAGCRRRKTIWVRNHAPKRRITTTAVK